VREYAIKYGSLQKGLAVVAFDEQDRLLIDKKKHIILRN
jgi:hypothetical protein